MAARGQEQVAIAAPARNPFGSTGGTLPPSP